MGALPNPISVSGLGTSRRTATPLRRREDPQRAALYIQDLAWREYVMRRLAENLDDVSMQTASRVAAKTKLGVLPPERGIAQEVRTSDSEEMRWLTENSGRLEIYRGEWLLIQGQELIAHSADFRAIRASIAERRIQSPFIYYVPTVEEANFISI